ncbi:MAG: transglutaminase domain-containing protein [Candidatus Hydrogenedentes bacterium]|nr:transglutaminase domain-containing protein [Candidatus Hydrogenedentota bacterium]
MRHRLLIAVAVSVTALWLVMMALLLRREVFVPHLSSQDLVPPQLSEAPSDVWMGIFMRDGAQVGYVNIRTRPEPRYGEKGIAMSVLGRVRLSMLGDATEMLASGETWLSNTQGLRDFRFSVRSGGHDVKASGAMLDGLLKAEITSGGEVYPVEFPIENGLRLSSGFGATHLPALEPGDEFVIDTFDPLSLSVSQTRIECVGAEPITSMGRVVNARIITSTVSGIKSRAWIDGEGEVLRAETPMGFTITRVSETEAMKGLAASTASDSFTQLAAVRPTGAAPFRGAQRMIVRFKDLGPGVSVPEDDTQLRQQDGSYLIQVPETPAGDTAQDDASPKMEAYLSGDAFVQVDAAPIQQKATEIVGETQGTWNCAMRIYEWVYNTIEKRPVLSIPSALDVLATGQGDCNEHTVLYTALARAAGVPTRIAIGVVWSEDYNAFYYHAWPEVYANGRWVWIDPTLGQPLADATHIKLLTGGLESWWQLVPFLGQLKIDVESIE